MENVIEFLRKFDGAEGCNWTEEREEIDFALDTFRPQGYSVEKVHSEFEDGGRWHNVETTIYKVEQNEEFAYFGFTRDVPASESQDGMDLYWNFFEAEPKEVTVIQYVAKG